MNESDVIATIQAMRAAISNKGDHSLFMNAAGTIMYHAVGSRGEKEMEKMSAFDRVGVYTRTSKLHEILADVQP